MKLISYLLPTAIDFILSGNFKKASDIGVESLQQQVIQGENAKKTLEAVGASIPISKEEFVNNEIDKKLKTIKDFMVSIMKNENELFTETDINYIKQFAYHIYVDVTPIHDMKNVNSTDRLFILSIDHPFNKKLTYKKFVNYIKIVDKNGNISSTLQIK